MTANSVSTLKRSLAASAPTESTVSAKCVRTVAVATSSATKTGASKGPKSHGQFIGRALCPILPRAVSSFPGEGQMSGTLPRNGNTCEWPYSQYLTARIMQRNPRSRGAEEAHRDPKTKRVISSALPINAPVGWLACSHACLSSRKEPQLRRADKAAGVVDCLFCSSAATAVHGSIIKEPSDMIKYLPIYAPSSISKPTE